jgi:hypothetical protein
VTAIFSRHAASPAYQSVLRTTLSRETGGTDTDETISNRNSSGRSGAVECVGVSIVACHRIRWHPGSVTFPSAWLLFLIFPFRDVLLFGTWITIT